MPALRIAIVHYHLRPGGVARVIHNVLLALRGTDCRVVVLSGSSPGPEVFLPGQVRLVAGLDYPNPGAPCQSPEQLVDALEANARKALGAPPDVWHFHNHALGKNTALSMAVYQLALRGHRLLLQIHDFSEDGRPANYRTLLEGVGEGASSTLVARLYPQAAHIHYAVINSRDRNFLCLAGMRPASVHLIPNAVDLGDGKPVTTPEHQESDRLFLYPTRAIRRKNLGELLFWAAMADAGDRFATTLAPTSPADLPPYRRWMALSQQLKLPVAFEIGRASRQPFAALLASATAVVTTSVAEGFGLVFLEPWLIKRPIMGRDLPEITCDFKAHNINLDGLYRHLLIPRDWIDPNDVRRKIESGFSQLLAAYGRPVQPAGAELAYQAALIHDRVDFGRLDEALQESVIRRLWVSGGMRSEISPSRLFPAGLAQKTIVQNHDAISRIFGLDRYRQQLEQVYEQVVESEPGPLDAIPGETLLDQFLAPERFYLLRT